MQWVSTMPLRLQLRSIAMAIILSCSGGPTVAADLTTVRLYAAGSLKAALTEAAQLFEALMPGTQVELVFGASGLLRERIESGETAHVFASADTGHPTKLAEKGQTSSPVAVFARNELCAIVREGLVVTSATLLDQMLEPAVRLGTSTPKADPSGDYAFALFAKADSLKPGAKAALEAKAQQLTGGPTSEKPSGNQNLYAWVMARNKADIFITYCTNAAQAKAEMPALQIVPIPARLNVGADYGIVVLKGAPEAASALADFIRSGAGQQILRKYGFAARG